VFDYQHSRLSPRKCDSPQPTTNLDNFLDADWCHFRWVGHVVWLLRLLPFRFRSEIGSWSAISGGASPILSRKSTGSWDRRFSGSITTQIVPMPTESKSCVTTSQNVRLPPPRLCGRFCLVEKHRKDDGCTASSYSFPRRRGCLRNFQPICP
jgi:hypothetical protein